MHALTLTLSIYTHFQQHYLADALKLLIQLLRQRHDEYVIEFTFECKKIIRFVLCFGRFFCSFKSRARQTKTIKLMKVNIIEKANKYLIQIERMIRRREIHSYFQ